MFDALRELFASKKFLVAFVSITYLSIGEMFNMRKEVIDSITYISIAYLGAQGGIDAVKEARKPKPTIAGDS